MNAHNPPKKMHANPKLERILLGGMILNNNLYWEIESSIRPDSFTTKLHRQMFEEIADMVVAGQAVKIPLLCARLPEDDEDENGRAVSVRSYISICIDQAGEVGASDVAEEVAELAAKRRLLRLSQEIAKAVDKGDQHSSEIASEIERQALDIVNVSSPRRPKRLSEIAKKVVANAVVARDTGKTVGFHTGLSTVDDLIGQIMPGDFGCIIASQSDGKTALARQIAKHVSIYAPVLEIQMEMSDEQLAARDIATASELPESDIMEGRVSAFDFERIEGAEKVIANYNYYIQDVPEATVRQIKGSALSMKRTKGLGLLLVDQLDKIRTERFIPNKFDRGTEVTRDLKSLAKDLGVPVIVLAQRTRMAQRSDSEVPRINDAEFPSLEKDVDWCLGLWRRETWLQQSQPDRSNEANYALWEEKVRDSQGRAGVVSLKRRRGKRFVRRELGWKPEITLFYDL